MFSKPIVWINIFLSLIILFLANISGEGFKFFVIPYIFYLLYGFKPENFPALIIISSGSTIISYEVLIGSFLFALTEYRGLFKSTIKRVLQIFIVLLPIVAVSAFEQLKNSLIESLNYSVYFLGFFPVFYGYFIGRNLNRISLELIFIPTFLIFFIELFGIKFATEHLRINSLFFIISGIVSFVSLSFLFGRIKISRVTLFTTLIIFIPRFFTGGLKFHLLFSILVALLIVYFMRTRKIYFSYKALRFLILLLPVFFFYAVLLNEEGVRGDLEEINYSDFTNYPQYIAQKLFDDRGGIWIGAYDIIKNEIGLLPPLNKILIDFKSTAGHNIYGFEAGAHNIFLELFLRLGIIVGATLCITLFYLVYLLFTKIEEQKDNDHYILLASMLIGVIIGGGITGQYILLSNFSFVLMSTAGLLIGYSEKNVR